MEDDFVGAIKIKDGLFIGDEYAAQDFEFIVTNKVTHIINCAGKQIPNYWETVGVVYLTFDWMDSENQVVFDAKGDVVNEIFNFVEEAVKMGEGVLVHSLKGQSRSCCVLTAYFMKRYRWSLYKTLEFLTSRRSDLEIRTSFYHQLLNLESRLFQQADGNVTVNWYEVGPENDHEEALLRNTFLNARNAPFDEVLINPQLQPGAVDKSRKLNWGDERSANKTGLHMFFSKESLAARLAKPIMSSIKSILKGSNKIFKHKVKNQEEDSTGSSKPSNSSSAGMRMHKSVRNLSEGRNPSETALNDTNSKTSDKDAAAVEKYQDPKNMKNANMHRSSSATYLDRDENSKSPISSKAVALTGDKAANGKVSNINGNVIHVTVNNYLAPVNNLSNATAPAGSAEAKDNSAKPPTGAQTQASRTATQKYNSNEAKKEEPSSYNSSKGFYPDSSASASNHNINQTVEKSMMSTNQLKSAIEKKLSKEYKSQMPTLQKGETPVIVTKISSDKNLIDAKSTKITKEYAKPNDIKVNYQVLLKNRETPPPRKREEAKRIPESPQKKSTSKSGISSKGSTADSSLPYSSYLNNLFSTSFSHLNTVTPSAYTTNYTNTEKKTPISTKATTPSMSYNLNLSQKAQTLTRPQRTASNQSSDKEYNSSTLGSSLTKSKLVYTNTPSPAVSSLGAKYNNYISQTKNNPVRITYEKIDRPHSATPDRSVTPQAGIRRMGTPSNVNLNRSGGASDQRQSVPSKDNAKHSKKNSGSTQDLLAKYRQRSSSPSQMSYNPVLSSSALSSKSRPKY